MIRSQCRGARPSHPAWLTIDAPVVDPSGPRGRRGTTPVSDASDWAVPPARPVATEAEVHVWRVSLEQPSADVDQHSLALNQDERKRAGRFVFERDRRRFAVTRGVLRAILGRYLRVAPSAIDLVYNSHGKPALRDGSTDCDLRFNVSHASELALIAITLGREVGVDIERVRKKFASEQVAASFFSPAEVAALRALPAARRCVGFFNCWTRKEAYVKARGRGLSLPLHRFSVSLAPGEPAVLLATADDPAESVRWSLREVTPDPGYVAALAVKGHGWRMRCWRWQL